MNLGDYRVNFKDYKYIQEPKIYVWHEHNTGRTIARIFSTGEKAENCRITYAKKSNQNISWCEGVFPTDKDRDSIRKLYEYMYPTLEFQDELSEEGRKVRGKDKAPRTRRTKEQIEKDKNNLIKIEDKTHQVIGAIYGNVEKYVNDLLKEQIKKELGL